MVALEAIGQVRIGQTRTVGGRESESSMGKVERLDAKAMEREAMQKKLMVAYKRIERCIRQEQKHQASKLAQRGREDALLMKRVNSENEALHLVSNIADEFALPIPESVRNSSVTTGPLTPSQGTADVPAWMHRTLRKCKKARIETQRARESLRRVQRRIGGLIRTQREAQRQREIARKRRERRTRQKAASAQSTAPAAVVQQSTTAASAPEPKEHESWQSRANERRRIAQATRGELGAPNKKVKFDTE